MPAPVLEKVMREKQGMQSDALLAGHTEWAPGKEESKAKQSARRMEELRQNSKPGTPARSHYIPCCASVLPCQYRLSYVATVD
jgi:hypothetical protein